MDDDDKDGTSALLPKVENFRNFFFKILLMFVHELRLLKLMPSAKKMKQPQKYNIITIRLRFMISFSSSFCFLFYTRKHTREIESQISPLNEWDDATELQSFWHKFFFLCSGIGVFRLLNHSPYITSIMCMWHLYHSVSNKIIDNIWYLYEMCVLCHVFFFFQKKITPQLIWQSND